MMKKKPQTCPTCKRPFVLTEPQRICARCKHPIRKHHKWQWVQKAGLTTIAHRNCKDPESYAAPKK